ncbi:MAG: hypothetical protein DCC71_18135 [Proteobacteria bacterium]|nr:MAG: hypothetical protein DCC71_18135 [Pseudomonadota bacterium]
MSLSAMLEQLHRGEGAGRVHQALVRGDVPIPTQREVQKATPVPDFERHVEQLGSVYEDVLAAKCAAAAAPR